MNTQKKSQERKFITKKRLMRLFPACFISLALSLMVFITAPLDIYVANIEELNFLFADFAPFMFLGVVLAVALFGAIMFCIPEVAYRYVFTFLFATTAMFFIQQNFLNFGMNSLPGDRLAGEVPSVPIIILDLLIWVAVYALAFVGATLVTKKKDKGEIISTVSLVLSLALFASQVTSPIFIVLNSKNSGNDLLGDATSNPSVLGNLPVVATEKYFDEFAFGRNIYYFCIDRFDEEYAEKAYSTDKDIFSELTGFTWYKDNVAAYGHTFPAIANMLTRKEYDCADKRSDFLDGAYTGDIPLKRLNDNGYSVNVYTEKYYSYTSAKHLPNYLDNLSKAVSESNSPSFLLAAHFATFSLYRAAPIIIKRIFDTGSTSDINGIITHKSEDDSVEWTGTNSRVEYLANQPFTVGGEEKKFSFIHFDGMHDIYQLYNPLLVPQLKSNLNVVYSFIAALKDNGLYKNATIIITGDHSRPVSDFQKVNESRRTALFVKNSGEDEGFNISLAPTSHDDIWATIFKSEGLDYADYGKAVGDLSETEQRTRKFVWHTYQTGSLDEYVYEIDGKASVFGNWKQTSFRHLDKFLMS